MASAGTVTAALAQAYEKGGARVRALAADLSDEQFWTKPYPYGNTFGHLVLHLTGNLNTYIGADIAGTDYVRDREREFTETAQPSKEATLHDFDDAVSLVLETLCAQTETSLSTPTASDRPELKNRFGVFLTCAAHLQHHIGQMIYLEKALNRKGG